jgi:hypothetical protein
MRLVAQAAFQCNSGKSVVRGEHLVLCQAYALPHDVGREGFMKAPLESPIEIAVAQSRKLLRVEE